MNEALPESVERWLSGAWGSTASPRTAAIEGKARFRREGKGLWLPIEAVMWHELGQHHVADLRVGLGPLTFVRGMDAYVDRIGFSRISHTLEMGPEIDQAAALFMWSEAILFPSSWQDREDVDWVSVDDHTADVSLPYGEARVSVRIEFDPVSAMPTRFSADRYKGAGSRPVAWHVDYSDWKPTADGVTLPGLATVTWSDEPGPWFRMWIERANPDADVTDAVARARALLAEIEADPTRRGLITRR